MGNFYKVFIIRTKILHKECMSTDLWLLNKHLICVSVCTQLTKASLINQFPLESDADDLQGYTVLLFLSFSHD